MDMSNLHLGQGDFARRKRSSVIGAMDALVCSLLRAGFGLVNYPHYRLFVRMTNEYNRACAVFTVILGAALIFLQRLSAFWTINHLQIPISGIGRNYVKLL